jgi:hypothetical protein
LYLDVHKKKRYILSIEKYIGRWWIILCNKFCIDIRLIKYWKKILSKDIVEIISWIFDNNIKSNITIELIQVK